jgi:hypothetical protein
MCIVKLPKYFFVYTSLSAGIFCLHTNDNNDDDVMYTIMCSGIAKQIQRNKSCA